MNNEFEMARRIATQAQIAANDAQRKLDALVAACRHEWSLPVYAPIVREAYTDPGDPPGTMGVDWRGPMFVPRHETPQWKRTCKICGKEETTQRSAQNVTVKPQF